MRRLFVFLAAAIAAAATSASAVQNKVCTPLRLNLNVSVVQVMFAGNCKGVSLNLNPAGHDYMIETLKYALRNKKPITVFYDKPNGNLVSVEE